MSEMRQDMISKQRVILAPEQAGTSLEHPHSQIVVTPMVPPGIRNQIDQAVRSFDTNGSCLFCIYGAINPLKPEEAAARLRDAEPSEIAG